MTRLPNLWYNLRHLNTTKENTTQPKTKKPMNNIRYTTSTASLSDQHKTEKFINRELSLFDAIIETVSAIAFFGTIFAAFVI